jgi:Uma2 family endonuclease
MSTAAKRRLTPEEYLAIERDVQTKHEFYQGEMFAMSGASRVHNQVTFNLALTLGSQLKDRDCTAYVNDMRVKVSATGLYTYPDVVVTCEKPKFEDSVLDTLLNPQAIIEVLSESTEKYDRGEKFAQYRQLPSLREYALVSQERPHIELFTKTDAGVWMLTEAIGLESTIDIPTIACRIALADVFAKVDFNPASSEPKD